MLNSTLSAAASAPSNLLTTLLIIVVIAVGIACLIAVIMERFVVPLVEYRAAADKVVKRVLIQTQVRNLYGVEIFYFDADDLIEGKPLEIVVGKERVAITARFQSGSAVLAEAARLGA